MGPRWSQDNTKMDQDSAKKGKIGQNDAKIRPRCGSGPIRANGDAENRGCTAECAEAVYSSKTAISGLYIRLILQLYIGHIGGI